ncbi:MAG: oligosaccharide flippase family protein [Bacteroidales bacterium]
MGFRNSVFNNSFIKNVLTLFSGTVIAQLIGLAFLPLLTRLFTPEEFGVFYIFLTTASILSIIATGGYEKSLVLPASENDAGQLLIFSILLSVAVTAISFLILLFLGKWGDQFFQTGHSRLILWLIPVYSLFFGVFRILQNTAIRKKNFRKVSGSNIIRVASASVMQAGAGFGHTGGIGLVLGSCIGQIFPLLTFLRKNKKLTEITIREKVKTAIAKGIEYKDFPLYKMPSDLLNEVSIQLPVYILKIIFSTAIAGIYSLPQKILSQPSKLIGQAAGEVYYRTASELNSQNKDLSEMTFNTFKVLFLLGVVPFTIISLWGKEIFSFIFSNEWAFSGRIAAFLSPWLLFVFAGSPVSYIFLIRQKLKISLLLNLVLLVARFAALLTGALVFKNLEITIILFAGISLIYWIFISFYSLYLGGIRLQKSLFFISSVLILSVVPLGLIKLFLL